ncbi:hypothetical protein BX600DRAFT_516021 [Xylariales sp. PMI_506]|nr:hypothetical protein BX600DRAFT_516021 [Xylariales sp. PMI_506]
MFWYLLLPILGFYQFVHSQPFDKINPKPGDNFYRHEIDVIAGFKSRLTGSDSHNKFLDYLEGELKKLGLRIHTDHFTFDYNAPPTSLSLIVNDEPISPSGYVPYSGNTDNDGITGRLVKVAVPISSTVSPNWTAAVGNIAWLDLYNGVYNGSLLYPVWAGSQIWGQVSGVPATNAGVRNLIEAAAAGVRGVIYNWMNVTSMNALGQYGPFKNNYQGIPAVYVVNKTMEQVQAQIDSPCTIISTGQRQRNRQTRTIYTIIEGTDLKNESIILSTHTDGANAVEENGYIGLLAKARELATSKPRRTTILVFVTGHLHTAGFTDTGRVMELWFQKHPELWAGNTTSAMKAVFGSCVEHLGAMHWREDLSNNSYYPTGEVQDELLYAATDELASLLGTAWEGAKPGVLRANDPNRSLAEQSGEGLPFLWNNIPEISLCTSPEWILKVWPADFDERKLMDEQALIRQVQSFLRVWKAVDGMATADLGVVNYSRIPENL